MKMSLRLMILSLSANAFLQSTHIPYILMAEMLEEFKLSVCSLGQDWSTEWFHDLLDGNGLASELIFCRAAAVVSIRTWV